MSPGFKRPAHRDGAPVRIGVAGTGFVAGHFIRELRHRADYELACVLSRRDPAHATDVPGRERMTDSVDALIEASDVIVECTGDVQRATDVVARAVEAGRPVVTLNPEFHVTTGSAFAGRGLLTEAEGDQPGCQAALWEDAVSMGFKPLVLGNMKGFLNRQPTPEDMRYWAERQGISLPMVTSFTDGTKLQVEQALVGNFFGADIAREELIGPETDDLNQAAQLLGEAAETLGRPITDYVLSRTLPHGVFLVARHDEAQRDALRYLKLGDGPHYVLIKNNIFVHLELFKTLRRVVEGGAVLLDNATTPRIGVAAVAKTPLAPGTAIERGCGSFELRGVCVRIAERPDHLPIGLADRLVVRRAVEPGQILTLDDVDLPPSTALDLWCAIRDRSTAAAPRAMAETV
ncbi:SAF domain-containing protein [Marinivivus vitaminiproducens]|uniref:SAF domain-containing protein n=1 Tax=Marinivivus vitaminiproducens TaxID=3035935 RepID=UPI00279EF2FB|nr:hypothetical protein P4R82_14910 [Geminicoccaceae bacterium SCSIO 64248]